MAEEASKKITEDNSGEILSKFNCLNENYENLRRLSARGNECALVSSAIKMKYIPML